MRLVERAAGDVGRLEALAAAERDALRRDRYRAVLLALEGKTAPEIADQIGRSRRFVQRWAYEYRDHGLATFHEKPRPGRPTRLPREQQERLTQRLDAGPLPSDGVCTLRGRDIRRILEQEFGVGYSLDGVYDLLQRLGYSYLKPRPRHRKNDPAAMRQWVQRAPLLSRPSSKPTPSGRSKSGSRMKPVSDNKAR